MRHSLARFTRTPLSGAVTGAVATVMVQSSNATTVTAVGFVGAGLLTFPQALGVLFGANIGSTATGWIVALLGFKLDLAALAPPLLFAGALLRLFGRGTMARVGMAVAGFSLMFIAVDTLRDGLSGFTAIVTPERFPPDTLVGRLALVGLGLAVTLVTQSSSVGVAMAMTALATGSISLAQAAAMVIGMDIGTTAAALLATVGGSTGMRRTGLAHVVFNLMTGAMAFMLVGPYAALMAGRTGADAAVALVTFHSGFNILGVVLVLPFAPAFARLIVRLVPERRAPVLRRLDPMLLSDPASALDAAHATALELSRLAFGTVAHRCGTGAAATSGEPLGAHVSVLRRYLEAFHAQPDDPAARERHAALLHATDHLARLARRCEQAEAAASLGTDPRLDRLRRLMGRMARDFADGAGPGADAFERLHRLLAPRRDAMRARVISDAVGQAADPAATLERLDGIRWIIRVAYHLWRLVHHLGAAGPAVGVTAPRAAHRP
jgi:phosphate:Na+ symporter